MLNIVENRLATVSPIIAKRHLTLFFSFAHNINMQLITLTSLQFLNACSKV